MRDWTLASCFRVESISVSKTSSRSRGPLGRPVLAGRYTPRRQARDTGRCPMKAIVVTDQAAGTTGMTLVERPQPEAASNDVLVEVHASRFTPGELTWPGTWTDRVGRDRTPSIPGHEVAGVVSA